MWETNTNLRKQEVRRTKGGIHYQTTFFSSVGRYFFTSSMNISISKAAFIALTASNVHCAIVHYTLLLRLLRSRLLRRDRCDAAENGEHLVLAVW
ncbi:hypothetical protein PR048_015593 [Dryococelus australis]|uniref:Uncharacterized protein n=1 Tax=Dryococelus australis TaxID=614101 RepID=A0ABQ9HHD9_9NEOP|nr:hypothetical protein PR048_015593 [Dryococelus australis]